MKITDALLGEHGTFYLMFDQIEQIAEEESAIAQVRGATTVLRAMVYAHATLEEELLFAALKPHLNFEDKELVAMEEEHSELERMLGHIEDAADVDEAIQWIPETLTAARRHFNREEEKLFPLAESLIDDAELHRLGSVWADMRHVKISP